MLIQEQDAAKPSPEVVDMFSEWLRRASFSSVSERRSALKSLEDFFQRRGHEVTQDQLLGFGLLVKGALYIFFDSGSRDALLATVVACASGTQKGASVISRALISSARAALAASYVAPKASKSAVFGVRLAVSLLSIIRPCNVENGHVESVMHDAVEHALKCLVLQQCWLMKANNKKLTRVAFQSLSSYLKHGSVTAFMDDIVKWDAVNSPEGKLVILEVLFWHLDVTSLHKEIDNVRKSEIVAKLKPSSKETLSVLLSAKSGVPTWLSANWSHVLGHFDLQDVEEALLPPLQRQMLRNPEVIVSSLADVFSGLANLDLSQLCEKFMKLCGPSIVSNDENIQQAGRLGFLALSSRCFQPSAVNALLNYLLSIVSGAEGKLATVAQKISAITAVRELRSSIPDEQKVKTENICIVLNSFAPLLKSEVSEPVLLEMLETLSVWCCDLTSMPKELASIVEVGLKLKASGILVQVAYLYCYLTALTSASGSVTTFPNFTSFLEDALRVSQTKAAVAANFPLYLAAAAVLFRLASFLRPGEELNKLLTQAALSAETLPFLSDKYIATLTKGGTVLQKIALGLIEDLVCNGCAITACVPTLMRTLTSSDRQIRALAANTVKRMCGSNSRLGQNDGYEDVGVQLALSLLTSLESVASSPLASSAFLEIACNPDFSDAQSLHIAEEVIVIAHSVKENLWAKFLERQRVPLERINVLKLLTSLTAQNAILEKKHLACVASLANFFVDSVFDWVVCFFHDQLSDPSLLKVTDQEMQLFHSPEGEVFDKSVIGQIVDIPEKNIKRESKAYTYEEQLFEIELKKISDQKKGTQFSQKQKEALAQQLEKENAIRERISALHMKVVNAKELLMTIVNHSDLPSHMVLLYLSPYMPKIAHRLFTLLDYFLTADHMADLFYDLIKLAAPQKYLGLSVFYASLRSRPNCKATVDKEWREEPLNDSLCRTVHNLYEHILGSGANTNPYHELISSELIERRAKLNSIFFNLCFPLLQFSLERRLSIETGSHCVMLMQAYYIQNFDENDNSMDLCNPGHLCSADVFRTLLLNGQHASYRPFVERAIMDICHSLAVLPISSEVVNSIIELLLSPSTFVRATCFQSLRALCEGKHNLSLAVQVAISQAAWIFRHDSEANVKKAADELWHSQSLEPSPKLLDEIICYVLKPQLHSRLAAGKALTALVSIYPDQCGVALQILRDHYKMLIVDSEPQVDNFGRIIDAGWVDTWYSRWGVAHALRSMANAMPQNVILEVVTFLIPTGLSDPHPNVKAEMLEVGLAVVDAAGKDSVSPLLRLIDEYLRRASQTAADDQIRQSVVIMMGALARHLDKNDNRIKPIVYRLLDLLSVPSQSVQEAVSTCLPPLAPAVRGEAPGIIKNLMDKLLNSENYGERRGAAYGMAGLVKGLGILSLKQMDIMLHLTDAIQEKKNVRKKEGALFAFEILCNVLGKLFEPYIVHILRHLLTCFGDSNQYVREATEATAKAMMRHLTGHGVKLTLPVLLGVLEDDSWRTKCGAIELLGSMAYCAPKQLSTCLPTVVPKLIGVLSDSHVKVQQAGAQALSQVGRVIKNPEIQEIVSVLLDALQDPSNKTQSSLTTLLETRFVHFIDAPSLALIMPVIQRAFQDRSTETRKMAAQIIGNMYSLTDQKDLMPYYPAILPGLKTCLLDPVPEVRTVSARALGTLVKGTGEQCFETLVPWLMVTLTSETSSVDRSGAAQGLAEVLGGMGVQRLQVVMPELIAATERADLEPHVRDGYLMMFIYLPLVFHRDFTPYIAQITGPILRGLADETEFVRDTALLAGQRIVAMYAETAIQLLLPELECGLFDDNWRIRLSSVQLIGDLLYKVSGVSGKMTTETADDDDNFGTEQSHSAIACALGFDRMNRLFAGLYIGRMDSSLMVRQASIHVWKVVVSNTPRTLREILPTMFGLLLAFLASNSNDKQQIAAKTLGDLVRKLGERVLPEIMPILEKGLDSEDPDHRQGVCIGLSEIIVCTPRQMVMLFLDNLVPTVRKALCDPLKEVRGAAAKTFDSLHTAVGAHALEGIITPLFDNLESADRQLAENTLDGLKQVMMLRSKYVLPHLVPQLIRPPVNTKALSHICSVAQGEALIQHFPRILDALLVNFSQSLDTPQEVDELSYCRAVVLAAQEPECVQVIVDTLLAALRTSEAIRMKRACVAILCAFCTNSKLSLENHFVVLMRDLIRLYLETDTHVLELAAEALLALVKQLRPHSEGPYYAVELRGAVRSAALTLRRDSTPIQDHLRPPWQTASSGGLLLPGLCTVKGAEPIISIYKDVLLNCGSDLKETAALGLGEMIELTDPAFLSSRLLSNFTGPLIRVLGDRYAPSLKTAIMHTLTLLLQSVGTQLRSFLPQLYSTFKRALSDAHRGARLNAAVALGWLTAVYPKTSAIIQELLTQIKGVDDASQRETLLFALRCILERMPLPDDDAAYSAKPSSGLTDVQRRSLIQSLLVYSKPTSAAGDEACRRQAAACLGALCRLLQANETDWVTKCHQWCDNQQSLSNSDWMVVHFRVMALQVALKLAPERIVNERFTELETTLTTFIASDKPPVAESALRATGFLLLYYAKRKEAMPAGLLTAFAKTMNKPSTELKQLVGAIVQFVCVQSDLPLASAKILAPHLVNGTKEKNTIVRANAESALIAMLKLTGTSSDEQKTPNAEELLNALDGGARDALVDVYNKTLIRTAAKQRESTGWAAGQSDPIDDTLLM